MILAGDIGGTNSRLALFDEHLHPAHQAILHNAGKSSLQEVVREFLAGAGAIAKRADRACFGVAGPVANGRVMLTNLNWQLDEISLATDLGVSKVELINDLVAHANGVELLRPENLIVLNKGEWSHGGNRAVIAAGTGLGEAGLVWDPKLGRHHAFASEGGHSDFSPQSDHEIELLRFLRHRQGFVEWESVLSGPGLRNIYNFLIDPDELGPGAGLSNQDPSPADISQAAMNGTSEACVKAIEMFVRFYGAEAGNLAVKVLATGGVYLGGGIAPHIIDKLKAPDFLDAFVTKGPPKIRKMLGAIPIYVINFELCALYGAANHASRM